MAKVLVIGYGNPLCGDDGVGWVVLESLESLAPAIETAVIHQLTPEWAEPISQNDLVIFVDAAVEGAPGEVRTIPLSPASERGGSHETTAEGVLATAADLFGHCPPAYMIAITGQTFELSESLSEPVAAAIPTALSQIMDLVHPFSGLSHVEPPG